MPPPTASPPSLLKSDEKLWVVLSHLSLFFGVGILLPLIVYLVKKEDSAPIAHHAKEALNFQISLALYALGCIPLVLVFVGAPLLLALGVASMVLAIIAAVQGAEGRPYRYPRIHGLPPRHPLLQA
ncbi:MAG TPA: DUF4870 domain-containing protein [Verrucomicrobiales bacterium]|nr:DUF4870 domain-containing protein [Verrucomicrobiales bacterium]